MQLTRVVDVGRAERDDPAGHIEVVDAAVATDLGPNGALEVDRVDARHARTAGWEVDPVPITRPGDACAVARAHVGDDAVGHGLVEACGQALGLSSAGLNDEQPVEEPGLGLFGPDVSDQVSSR